MQVLDSLDMQVLDRGVVWRKVDQVKDFSLTPFSTTVLQYYNILRISVPQKRRTTV